MKFADRRTYDKSYAIRAPLGELEWLLLALQIHLIGEIDIQWFTILNLGLGVKYPGKILWPVDSLR